jgi:transposase
MEAMRCLRRRLSDVVYRQLIADAQAQTAAQAGPGERTRDSSGTALLTGRLIQGSHEPRRG